MYDHFQNNIEKNDFNLFRMHLRKELFTVVEQVAH